jgi:ATP-dependent DNA helicase RecQ
MKTHVGLLLMKCIVSWGHDFRPSYQQLGFLNIPAHAIIALTATADKATRQDIVITHPPLFSFFRSKKY